jgi:hypothetical protein
MLTEVDILLANQESLFQTCRTKFEKGERGLIVLEDGIVLGRLPGWFEVAVSSDSFQVACLETTCSALRAFDEDTDAAAVLWLCEIS